MVTGRVGDRLESWGREELPFALDVAQERMRCIYESGTGEVCFIDRASDTEIWSRREGRAKREAHTRLNGVAGAGLSRAVAGSEVIREGIWLGEKKRVGELKS